MVQFAPLFRFQTGGFLPLEQLRLKEAELAQKEYAVSRDKAKLMVLEKFTKKRQESELTAKAVEAKRALAQAGRTIGYAIDHTWWQVERSLGTRRSGKTRSGRRRPAAGGPGPGALTQRSPLAVLYRQVFDQPLVLVHGQNLHRARNRRTANRKISPSVSREGLLAAGMPA